VIEATQKVMELKNKLDSLDYQLSQIDKYFYNSLLKKGLLSYGYSDRKMHRRHIINGCAFLELLIPFFDAMPNGKDRIQKFVNANNVLAGNYRDYPLISDEKAINVTDYLDQLTKEGQGEQAIYNQIGDFELYIASEGKNRIALYRQLERGVLANVSTFPMPEPDKLQLILLKPFNIPAVKYIGKNFSYMNNPSWKQLGNSGYIIPLVFKESIPLLESYGVKWGQSIWRFKVIIQVKMAYVYLMHRFYSK
tara:strand:- start:12888 stop:13637 length:750 start_codon:yes stop_codon:yes gene_type:complete